MGLTVGLEGASITEGSLLSFVSASKFNTLAVNYLTKLSVVLVFIDSPMTSIIHNQQ
jgi:hypothetical protein